ncbi:GDP-mannose 4,6-dehydratase [Actinomadura barringtoniae]|uniref:GDP-mannose 4,6-dehydratase n=1 Tax=Actinomadura barringtoniae TaxID=1427535 RepID=UPI001FB6B960|nr:GDP-mannose 4,6-dehydratase [Actinomadura barringtoniae]
MNGWERRKVLVTGAEGFIGSTLVDRLTELGADVRAFTHYKPYGDGGHLAGRENDVEIVTGDLRDPGRVYDAVDGCEVVFHLAALIGIPYSYEAPNSYVQTNVIGTQHVAAASLRHAARLVHTSTSEVYGTARIVPIPETHPLQPQSPYSASKIGADMMALSYWHAFELPVAVVRPFNTYGPRQSARAVIPTILGQLHAGARQIALGATTPTRDFNYVTDTVNGFIAAADNDAVLGEAVNIGSGREISVGDLAELLIKITGADAEVVTDRERLRPSGSEVERLLADTAKARELLGYEPQVTLEEGLARTSEWVRDNLDRIGSRRYER